MDRNAILNSSHTGSLPVALRKESVDRNLEAFKDSSLTAKSLSARRAWIEIGITMVGAGTTTSLSARRAWIEMTQFVPITTSDVSLSARRAWIEIDYQGNAWRS